MSFLHMSLIAGLAVVTVPIMLHLFGQRQPQLIDFPALRFVRETTSEQSTSWQLRHFLLLLLRILLLAALAFALARPRVHSAMLGSIIGVTGVGLSAMLASLVAAVAYATKRPTSVWLTSVVIAVALWSSAALWGYRSITTGPAVPSSDQSAPVAAALIIDNGPTMAYRFGNELRLKSAKDIALWILDQLPIDSRVGILGGAPVGSLALDPATASMQVKLIETRGAHIDLLSRIRTSLDLVLASDLERKEIYVITDLMSASWMSAQPGLKEMLDEYRGEVLVQIIDIGVDDKANWQLGDPKPDLESLPAGGDAAFEIDVRRSAAAPGSSDVTVELLQTEIDPRLPVVSNGELRTPPSKVVDRKVVDLSSSTSQTVRLEARGLVEGTHHFRIRLDRTDPLMIDNERYISIAAKSQRPTLIVTDDPQLGQSLQYIVDPGTGRGGERLAEQVRYSQLSQTDLDRFAVVCLYDPSPLSTQDAVKLKQHVEQGGGLFLILGPSLGTPESISGNPLLQFLPGELGPITQREPSDRNVFLTPLALSHPMFQILGDTVNEVPWQQFPVFRSWSFSKIDDDAQKLIELSGRQGPVMLSQNVGRGTIMTLCTPIPEYEIRGRPLWNELWIADEPVYTFALLWGAMRSLSGTDQEKLNYQVGSSVVLRNDTQVWPTLYELFSPNPPSRPVRAVDGTLNVGEFETVGTYHLRGVRGDPVSRGFSVNAPAEDTQLQRVEKSELDSYLGDGNYRIARDRDQVQSSVGQARFGRELYPLLMVFVAGLFLAEQAMSNRFYKLKFSRT